MRDIVEIHAPCQRQAFSDEGSGMVTVVSALPLPDDISVTRVQLGIWSVTAAASWRCAIYRMEEKYRRVLDVIPGGIYSEPYTHQYFKVAESPTIAANTTTNTSERAWFHFSPAPLLKRDNKYVIALACNNASNGMYFTPGYYHQSGRIAKPNLDAITSKFPNVLFDDEDADLIHGAVSCLLLSKKGVFHRTGI